MAPPARSHARLAPAEGATTLSAVSARPLTRRRALALGAAAGLSSLLARSTPSFARPSVRGADPRSFGLDIEAGAFGADGRTAALRAPRRFDLLGLRGDGLHGRGIEVRVRRHGGAWSRWVPVGPGRDHRPDTGSGAHASDPVWAGGADELQLRAARAPGSALRLHFVTVPAAAKRRGARAARAARAHASQLPAGAPTIIPRAAWGGDAVRPRATPEVGDVQIAFVHHTVTANDYGPGDSAGIVLGIAKYHRDVNGWNDLGYNFLVDKYGQIFEGRAGGVDQAIVGAQAQGWNSHSTGIANLGTFQDIPETDAALDAMARLIAWKLPFHGVPVNGQVVVRSAGGASNRYRAGTDVTFERISGHRDGCSTECPGNALYAQLPELRTRAARIAPAGAARARATLEAPGGAEAAYGAPLAISGAVALGDGSPVAGQAVSIQKRGRSGRWVTVARAQTDAQGLWTAQVTWRASGQLRAHVKVPGTPTVVSAALDATCLPVLEAAVTTRRVRQWRRVPITGTVRPIAPVTVKVERRGSDGRYRKVDTVTIKPRQGRFRASIPLGRAGLYRLTPTTGRGGATARAASQFVRAVRR